MLKRTRFGFFFFALLLVATSCAPAAGPKSQAHETAQGPAAGQAPKWITAAFMSEPPALQNRVNSAVAGGRTSAGVNELEELLNSGLVIAQDRGILHPRLAEAVPTLENGLWRVLPDGRMETTWRIKPGARWHDGTPFTAQDLAFSAQVAGDAEVPFIVPLGYKLIQAVEVVDDRTVTVKWKQPYIEADILFDGGDLVPKHILERAYIEDKEGFAHLPYWSTDFVGLGPFKLREFARGSHMVLEANSDFVLGRPKIDGIEIKFFLDPNTLAANILAGAVELTIGPSLATETALHLGSDWRGGRVEVSPEAAGNPMHLFPQFINPDPPVIADVRFRRALLHAINRQELVDATMAGKAVIAHGILWDPNNREWDDIDASVVRYGFDPRRATQLIDELGYAKGSDGLFRERATNQHLSTELRTLASFDTGVKLLFPIADYWQRGGVGVETLVVPQQRQADRRYRAERPAFEITRSPRNLTRHHSNEIALPENNFRGANRARYSNPELDTLIDRYYVTIPWRERMAVLSQVVHHMTDQVTVMGLAFDPTPIMVANRLVNVKGRPGGTAAWNAHEWDVRP